MLEMNFKIDFGCGIKKAYVLLRVNLTLQLVTAGHLQQLLLLLLLSSFLSFPGQSNKSFPARQCSGELAVSYK